MTLNKYYTIVLHGFIILYLTSCATKTANKIADETVDRWCECLQEHKKLGKETAVQLCTEKYKSDMDVIMRKKMMELRTTTNVSDELKDSLYLHLHQKKVNEEFHRLNSAMGEKAKRCLSD